jgi:hypothetical protein
MFTWTVHLCLLGEALIYGAGLLFILGAIPEWGRWYSNSPYYSAQTDALLHGQLALSHSLSDEDHDLAWANGGIQQVWGLGIPILRLPLAALARLFGCSIFPEHLATGLALSLVAFLVLMILVKPAIMGGQSIFAVLPSLGSVALLLLFPPFLTLFHTRFWVYEEATAHTYLYGVAEAVLLLQYLWKPSKRRWMILMLVAGFGAFIRPTLVFYGFAAWLTGTLALLWPAGRSMLSLNRKPDDPSPEGDSFTADRQEQEAGPLKTSKLSKFNPWSAVRLGAGTWMLGSFLFYLGILALLLTNWMRFGSPAEFGHKLNVQLEVCDGSLYATRFNYPFEAEPFPVVLKELIGALFFVKSPPHATEDYYDQHDLFWGQAQAPRMREMYFKPYDWTYIIPLVGAAILVGYWLCRSFRRRLQPQDALLMEMGVWCLVSLAPLFWFYLRVPAIFSRYLLDLAPGFVVLIAIMWFVMVSRLRGIWRIVGVLLLGGWMSWEIVSAIKDHNTPSSLSWSELSSRHKFGKAQTQTKSIRVGSQTTKSGDSGIPYDGIGWNPTNQCVRPLVIVFVEDAQFLELELSSVPDASENPDPDWVRAKIGLEFLVRESVAQAGNVWRIRFKGPKRADYRRNVQPAFIAVVSDTHLADKTTPWILHRVRWRDATPDELVHDRGDLPQTPPVELPSIPASNAPATNAPPPARQPKLQGIVYAPKWPTAIVDGRTVHVGDRLGQFRVKGISQDTVTLERTNGVQEKLKLGR